MEEQKKTKGIKLNQQAEEKADKKADKLSYEQLTDVANRLVQENQYLKQQLQKAMQTIGMFNRIDYLFKVLQYEQVIKDAEFINNCVNEIKDSLTIPPSEESEGEEA